MTNRTPVPLVRRQAGFSLIELLVACGLMTIVMAAIFSQIQIGQKSSVAEQAKLDLFQEARVFVDQMSRDVRTTGFPNLRDFSANPCGSTSGEQQCAQEAVGLIKLDNADLWFEGSIDGSSQVYLIQYHLDSTCQPLPCLRRSQTPKQPGDPLANATAMVSNYQTEVQNVQNGAAADPIFRAYLADGTQVTLPVDLVNNAVTIAGINSIAVKLTVQSPYRDPQTRLKPTITLLSTVRLHNCSAAVPPGGTAVMGC